MSESRRRLQFAHFLLNKTQEMRFRLEGMLCLCKESRRRSAAAEDDASGSGRLLNYHFSAFSSLVQTIKDVLPVVIAQKITWSDLSQVPHLQFMRAVRNAITHDGNPVINIWVEGRYYVASFVRVDQNDRPVPIDAPTEDIESVLLSFSLGFCQYLRNLVSPLLGESQLQGPAYGAELFDAAINHPAVPDFARALYAQADQSAPEQEDCDPLMDVVRELDSLELYCRSQ